MRRQNVDKITHFPPQNIQLDIQLDIQPDIQPDIQLDIQLHNFSNKILHFLICQLYNAAKSKRNKQNK